MEWFCNYVVVYTLAFLVSWCFNNRFLEHIGVIDFSGPIVEAPSKTVVETRHMI